MAFKETKRKAFNFFRSYYDVYNELPVKDKLPFMEAVLNKQFLGIEPDLTGISKLAYISIKHSIDSQVKGYETKTRTKLTPPTVGATQGASEGATVGATQGASVQEEGEEKGKEKEKVQYVPEFEDFKNYALSKKTTIDIDHLKLKYDSWVENGWKNGNHKKIKNWKSALLNTIPHLKEKSSAKKENTSRLDGFINR